MLTVDALRNLGADVEDGIRRCVNSEAFYLKMVGKALPDLRTEELKAALAAGDLARAFEICHTLKGVLANLSLTPALAPVSEMRAHGGPAGRGVREAPRPGGFMMTER